ncbi:MAG: SHOCT domain-containing protein [Ilumatobacteraceae bacterium]
MATRAQEMTRMMHRQWMEHTDRPWLWLLGMAMMVVFWGGLIWAVISLVRRGSGGAPVAGQPTAVAPPTSRVSAEEILAERLARGEIDPDEYRVRLEALRSQPPTPPSA